MLRAHRQAWAWQDEWFGLTMEDIRRLERETQDVLAKKMALEVKEDSEEGSEEFEDAQEGVASSASVQSGLGKADKKEKPAG